MIQMCFYDSDVGDLTTRIVETENIAVGITRECHMCSADLTEAYAMTPAFTPEIPAIGWLTMNGLDIKGGGIEMGWSQKATDHEFFPNSKNALISL